jgi:prepilin-type N-terminal cleavage/methylation domain-containing protein
VKARGLTLIELLAVVVILSMVAGVATVGLSATSDAAGLRAALAGWQDLDARARISARSGGPVTLALDQEQNALVLRRGAEHLAEFQLPQGVTVHVESSGRPDRIEIDRHGRSIDYEVAITLGERVTRVSVRGLTGVFLEHDS